MWFPWSTHKNRRDDSSAKDSSAKDSSAKPKRKNGSAPAQELAYFEERGPFDIVGDVHGCLDELLALMNRLGYSVDRHPGEFVVSPPPGRKLAFVGDLSNRGPGTPDVLQLVMDMVRAGQALTVAGNQDVKLARALHGRDRKFTAGVERSLLELECEPPRFRARAAEFLDALATHYVLNEGTLVIAHAGLKEKLHGSASDKARKLAIFGETTGKTDEYGLPIRDNWALDYRGKALVVFGHTPVPEPLWLNNTVNLDTGCVYGGYLSALRYPERETVSVPARAIYYPSRKRFLPNKALAQSRRTLVSPL